MYRARREWAWNDQAEHVYQEKRKRLAEKGYSTDEEVCQYFAEQGVEDVEPRDIRPMMLDAITASPLERLLSSLS